MLIMRQFQDKTDYSVPKAVPVPKVVPVEVEDAVSKLLQGIDSWSFDIFQIEDDDLPKANHFTRSNLCQIQTKNVLFSMHDLGVVDDVNEQFLMISTLLQMAEKIFRILGVFDNFPIDMKKFRAFVRSVSAFVAGIARFVTRGARFLALFFQRKLNKLQTDVAHTKLMHCYVHTVNWPMSLDSFHVQMVARYQPNPYHNFRHACDVLHAT